MESTAYHILVSFAVSRVAFMTSRGRLNSRLACGVESRRKDKEWTKHPLLSLCNQRQRDWYHVSCSYLSSFGYRV